MQSGRRLMPPSTPLLQTDLKTDRKSLVFRMNDPTPSGTPLARSFGCGSLRYQFQDPE